MMAGMAKQGSKPAQQPESDEALLLRFGRGELPAFEALYQRHAAQVWRYIRRSVDDATLADELLQEVWLRVIAHARGYSAAAPFTAWLFTLVRDRMLDALRARHPEAMLEGDDGPAGAQGEPFAAALRGAPGDVLLAALAALPHPQREAFLLQAEGALGVAQIAAVTRVPVATARSRLRAACVALRAALEVRA
jgi:RNA polymerase sigma-70 factor (ECF subfamily)